MPASHPRHRRPPDSAWSAARLGVALLAVTIGVILACVWVM
ncbi:hypothetical protein OG866_42145 [Streptomyces sp. NBC_00663]|nr:hypothetical protein [Streptomyces sp. NBC_00663]